MIYQWKVELTGIHPPIWRRFQTFGDITFDQLHKTLQIIMGWKDYHLYMFGFPDKMIHIPDPDFPNERIKELDARQEKISVHVTEEGQHFIYLYDYGDNWEHELVLERIVEQEKETYPVCLEGERHCPPEDVGGVPGYLEVLEILQNKSHPEYEHTLMWVGGRFNPEAFMKEKVNQQLWQQAVKLNPKQKQQPYGQKKGSKLTVPQLRKQLQNLPQDELVRLVVDCVKASKEAKHFFMIQLAGEEALEEMAETYRKKIREEFFPTRGEPKLRLSETKKAIREFEKLSQNKRYTIDLYLYYVEMGVEFTNIYGDITAGFYSSLLSVYDSVAKMLYKEGNEKLIQEFEPRMRAIVEEADGIGWGFHDTLQDIYAELFA
ncbi:DUF6155 family protein [Aneurinibacillus danicus]|jgi:hypothetical protein|uniref:Plasmid pRiA4b Orf3-like domain-containing protein n=1 Tax=Aneurinibacillus danicus TaxID=267746 RepID=A0A511V248_9BACL|nr:DUF6155 family protein [Aneurinibacillus danicus]GEN32975.1 hypothetical protein ADA01nite_04350 [Aneurinibacillus danicus]